MFEIVLPRKELFKLVSRCQGVADKKSTMPALSNILFSTKTNRIVASATDLFLSIRSDCEAKIVTEGSYALPAREIFERIKAMPEGDVILSVTDQGAATIRSTTSPRKYTLYGISSKEFPQIPLASVEEVIFEISEDSLNILISKTHFSCSSDETRPNINGCFFEMKNGTFIMVSTDGHRLTKMAIKADFEDVERSMLIPQKGVLELKKLLDEARNEKKEKGRVRVSQTGHNVFFHFENGVALSVKLIDSPFLPYDQIIPTRLPHQSLKASKMWISDAFRAVSLSSNERTGGVKIYLEKNLLRITSESPESGNGFDEVSIEYEGSELKAAYNAKYFLDVFNVIEQEEVEISITGELDPAVVRPLNQPEDQNYEAVVMPMRI